MAGSGKMGKEIQKMKECRECEYFNGYDYDDGTPICDYDGGYENCPYCDSSNIKQNGFKIEIDAGFLHDYIKHTLKNTIADKSVEIANSEVKKLVTEEIKDTVRSEMERQISNIVSAEIDEFMKKDITIGGGWCEPERKLTRQQYLSEMVETELNKRFKGNELKNYAESEARKAIDKFNEKLRSEINSGIKNYFNEATRQILTENVVSMLMSNETYQKLSNYMQTFLPEKEQKR